MYINKIRVCLDAFKRGRAALAKQTKWETKEIRVFYMDGSFSLQRKVALIARKWSDYSGITFIPAVSKGESDVRVTFAPGGSWSFVGTQALQVPYNEPTMQLGWVTEDMDSEEMRQVVLHEFGHVLGLLHEHQNPHGGIQWDKDRVYAYYMGYPNYWSKQQVDDNVFARYSSDQTQFTEFDPRSIMLYPVPEAFTVDEFEVGWNTELSDMDKQFIKEVYA